MTQDQIGRVAAEISGAFFVGRPRRRIAQDYIETMLWEVEKSAPIPAADFAGGFCFANGIVALSCAITVAVVWIASGALSPLLIVAGATGGLAGGLAVGSGWLALRRLRRDRDRNAQPKYLDPGRELPAPEPADGPGKLRPQQAEKSAKPVARRVRRQKGETRP